MVRYLTTILSMGSSIDTDGNDENNKGSGTPRTVTYETSDGFIL
jgi:hypothetical protein